MTNVGILSGGRGVAQDRSSSTIWLLAVLVIIVLPTGFNASFLPWFCVETTGAAVILWQWRQGKLETAYEAWRVAIPLSAWLGSSAAVATIQLVCGVTESPFDTFRQLHYFAGGLLFIPVVASGFPAMKAVGVRDWAASATSALLVASLIAGSLGQLQPDLAENSVIWWPFIYRNHYAAFVLLLLPSLCWHAFARPGLHWGAAVGVVAGVAGVVSSASRSGLVLLALMTAAYGTQIWLRSGQARRLYIISAVIATVSLGAALANSDGIAWRLQHSGSLLEGRLDYWQATLQMIAERPLLGWGFGTWPDVYPQFLIRDAGIPVNHAHSDWLELFAEAGVAPALALGILCARSLWLAFRQPWSMGVPVVLLLAMVDYPLRLPILMLALLLLYVPAELALLHTRQDLCRNHDF